MPALNETIMKASTKESSNSSRDNLSEFDVLCGRDKRALNHQGNRRFRVVVSLHQERYASSNSRKDKSITIKNVIAMIESNGGRFLRSNNCVLEALSNKEIHEKVAHAFRDAKKTSKSSSAGKQLKRKVQNEQTVQEVTLLKDQRRPFPAAVAPPQHPASSLAVMTADPLPLSDIDVRSTKHFQPSYSMAPTTLQCQQNQEDPFGIFEEVSASDIDQVLNLQMGPLIEEELPSVVAELGSNYSIDSLDDAIVHWLIGERAESLFYMQQQQQQCSLSFLINSINHENDGSWQL